MGPNATQSPAPDRVGHLLTSLGCDPAFIDDVLGDLSQEYESRWTEQGAFVAGIWYAREILRSAPHVAWSAIRHGNPAARARLAGCALAVIVTLSLIAAAWMTRKGPPARLVAAEAYSDGVVVNSLRPVQLSIGVLDAAGHRLERKDVRYERVSGPPIRMSRDGVVQCTERGEVVVRASLASLRRDFVVYCEPIKKFLAMGWGNFLVGEPARRLSVGAIGPDGAPVTRIAATIRVEDSTIATLHGSELRPLRPGFTRIDLDIGDEKMGTTVTVFEPVPTLAGLRPGQRWVVVPVHLNRGESVRWPLPAGYFFLTFSSDSTQIPEPNGFKEIANAPLRVNMALAGPVMCLPELQPGILESHCLARGPGATLTLVHPGRTAPAQILGTIALERSPWE